ncbi:MAG TPA: hypothetical protein VMG10_23265, partial [Gemmataceae bacterium]|nr:hypothetical protein [Gemmataceae bacterium]
DGLSQRWIMAFSVRASAVLLLINGHPSGLAPKSGTVRKKAAEKRRTPKKAMPPSLVRADHAISNDHPQRTLFFR